MAKGLVLQNIHKKGINTIQYVTHMFRKWTFLDGLTINRFYMDRAKTAIKRLDLVECSRLNDIMAQVSTVSKGHKLMKEERVPFHVWKDLRLTTIPLNVLFRNINTAQLSDRTTSEVKWNIYMFAFN